MGGRGASSAGGGAFSTGGGGKVNPQGLAGQTYIDGKRVSVEGTLKHWEGKSKDLKHEELLLVGEDGFAVGYFKGGSTSVAYDIPKGADPSKLTLTHNHPYGTKATGGRTKGGSFSNADLKNHIVGGFKETRATSREGTYSFKATKGVKPDAGGFLKALKNRQSECKKKAKTTYEKAQAKGSTKSYIDTYLDTCHMWYQKNCSKYGYTYSFTPNK